MLSEDADETLLSQASQISDPEEEVGIWCDEKEIQNKRRQKKAKALCISLTLASKTAWRLCQSLSIYSKPTRSSTLQSTKLFCDPTTLVVITVGP